MKDKHILRDLRQTLSPNAVFWPDKRVELLNGQERFLTGGTWPRLKTRKSTKGDILQAITPLTSTDNAHTNIEWYNTTFPRHFAMQMQQKLSYFLREGGIFEGYDVSSLVIRVPLALHNAEEELVVTQRNLTEDAIVRVEIRAAFAWYKSKQKPGLIMQEIADQGIRAAKAVTQSTTFDLSYCGYGVIKQGVSHKGPLEFLGYTFKTAEDMVRGITGLPQGGNFSINKRTLIPKITPQNAPMIMGQLWSLGEEIAKLRGEKYTIDKPNWTGKEFKQDFWNARLPSQVILKPTFPIPDDEDDDLAVYYG